GADANRGRRRGRDRLCPVARRPGPARRRLSAGHIPIRADRAILPALAQTLSSARSARTLFGQDAEESTPVTRQHNVEVVDYDPSWPERFAAERAVLAEALAPWLAGIIEHVGSTAVPGLCAKPVIDIMVPVRDLPGSRPAIAVAETLGYRYWPYKTDVMHWFCKPGEYIRTHHLHMIPMGSQLFRDRLAFRDALRSDVAVRQQYAELKRGLAAQHPHDREAYTQAKWPFISRVLAGL
ncbi:MAG: GrpB family protein, partial [Myxococcota bacterium]